MQPGDKFSLFLVSERSKIENSTVDPATKKLLKELLDDFVRFLERSES